MAVKVIDVKVGIFDENNRIADEVRAYNRENGTFMVNIMASPGAGKTTTLLRTIKALSEDYRIGVMEADIEASVDAEKMADAGVASIQVHTGGECAMDASMVQQSLQQFDTSDLDILFMENVGNLVCTAEQDTGADVNVEILSLPEGDDKPLKYPLMFQVCQCVLINKIDTREWFSFDDEAVKERIHRLNPEAEIFFVSSKTGEGFDEWIEWLRDRAEEHAGKKALADRSGQSAGAKAGEDESFRILTINPGSTSTKIAVFEDEEEVFSETLRHSAEELDVYETIADQWDFRRKLVMDELREHGLKAEDMNAISCRGGLIRPIPSGTYRVGPQMLEDCRAGVRGQHASNLGALIGAQISEETGVPAFVVDPPSVDEMSVVAQYSGHPSIRRTSLFHALNQKAVARRYAEETGRDYEELNLVVCHMGGGVSVGAHACGEVVDTENAFGGEGPFTPGRAGSMPVNEIVDLCFQENADRDEIMDMLTRRSGMMAYLGTTSMQEIEAQAEQGEDRAQEALDAFCYQVAKEIAAMSVALNGKTDQILLTGGIAYGEPVTERLRRLIGWIAPVTIYPGEDEMLSLAQGALRVLRGDEAPKEYR